MAKSKKTTLGIQNKPKTKEDLNQEYGSLAVQVGHKCRILQNTKDNLSNLTGQLEKEIARLDAEIKQDTKVLIQLATEAAKSFPEHVTPIQLAPSPTTETSTA